MHRQADAVVGAAVLREIVGADLLAAVPGAHLPLPLGVDGVLLFLLLLGQQAAAQDLQGLILVLELAALVLALHHHAGGNVRHPDGAGRLVDVLAARTGGTEGVDAQVLHVQRKVHFLCLGHHGHRGGGGVDAALGLGLGHALHPMHPALVLEAVVGPGPFHRKDGFLHAAQLGLVEVEQFQRPAAALHIHGVHAQQTVGKQGSFLSPCPAPDLHDDVLFVPRVPGQQQNFEIIFQLFHILTFFADFLLYHLLEVRIGDGFFEQGFGLRQMVPGGLPVAVGLHHRLRLVVVPHQFAEQCRVGSGIRLVQADGKLFKPVAHGIHLGRKIGHNRQFSLQTFSDGNGHKGGHSACCAGLTTFLMFFSIFARGSITSRPQPVQRILKSMPTRSTSKLEAPQGCFLRVRMVSPTAISIALVAPFCRPSEWSAATVRHPDHRPCRTYRYSIMQTPAKCKYLPHRMHIVENGSVLCPAQRRTQKSTEKEE